MKYSELEKFLRKHGCIPTGKQRRGHPEWKNPSNGQTTVLSNHKSKEVANGTLANIMKGLGL